MSGAIVRSATARVGRTHLDRVFVVMPVVRMVEVPVVEVVDVVSVHDGGVTAARPVLMIVSFMYVMRHCVFLCWS